MPYQFISKGRNAMFWKGFFRKGGSGPFARFTGLTSFAGYGDAALVGDHAGIGVEMSDGSTVTSVVWGTSRADVEASFTPLDLFASSEKGAWYDPSDLSTLWKDTAGTDPVTTAGDTVARMDDKSGNGNHATQATSAARPTYRTDGTLHWLEFDGVDDQMSALGVFGADATVFSMASGAGVDEGASTYRILSLGNVDVDGLSTSVHFAPAADASLRYDGSSTSGTLSLPSGYTPQVRLSQRNGQTVADWFDGTDNISPGTSVSLNDTVDDLYLAGGAGGANPDARLYGVVVTNDIMSSSERSSVESYLANKSGVTL